MGKKLLCTEFRQMKNVNLEAGRNNFGKLDVILLLKPEHEYAACTLWAGMGLNHGVQFQHYSPQGQHVNQARTVQYPSQVHEDD